MQFDFEQSGSKGVLSLIGRLTDEHRTELRRLLGGSAAQCRSLLVRMDDVVAVTPSCISMLRDEAQRLWDQNYPLSFSGELASGLLPRGAKRSGGNCDATHTRSAAMCVDVASSFLKEQQP